jgi:hypothetical protein
VMQLPTQATGMPYSIESLCRYCWSAELVSAGFGVMCYRSRVQILEESKKISVYFIKVTSPWRVHRFSVVIHIVYRRGLHRVHEESL